MPVRKTAGGLLVMAPAIYVEIFIPYPVKKLKHYQVRRYTNLLVI
jgi:hypothetical protein